jgi:signal transduction histidine kinase
MLAGGYITDEVMNKRVIDRCQRNIARIVDMQYKLEDIISEPDQRVGLSLAMLLDLCTEELETLVGLEGGAAITSHIRDFIDTFFSRRTLKAERISLNCFVASKIIELKPLFAHRRIDVQTDLEQDAGNVYLPVEILDKIVTGLVRNAIEYTPDGGQVRIRVLPKDHGPRLVVYDYGVGITKENIRLINGQYFTTTDTYQYATGNPFDFNAGGRGLDLLRMKVFSERYPLKLSINSERCRHILTSKKMCPGSIDRCVFCNSIKDCHQSGGSTFTVIFGRSNHQKNEDEPSPSLNPTAKKNASV